MATTSLWPIKMTINYVENEDKTPINKSLEELQKQLDSMNYNDEDFYKIKTCNSIEENNKRIWFYRKKK